MADSDVRDLERAWRSSGSEADYRGYLQARQRAGTLPQEALQVAAYLGDVVAQELAASTVRASKGTQRFFAELPGGERVSARASGVALRVCLGLPGARVDPDLQRAAEVALAWTETLEPTAGAQTQLEELDARLAAAAHHFQPHYPAIALTYELDEEHALAVLVWILLRRAAARVERGEWEDVGRCLHVLCPKKAQQSQLRAAVRDALVPWLVLEDAELESDSRGDAYALFSAEGLSAEQAAAVAAAGPPAGKPTLLQSVAMLETYLVAAGWRPHYKAFLSPDGTLRIKLKARVLHVLEGGPGNWSKLASTKNRHLYLTDLAEHLRASAEQRIERG